MSALTHDFDGSRLVTFLESLNAMRPIGYALASVIELPATPVSLQDSLPTALPSSHSPRRPENFVYQSDAIAEHVFEHNADRRENW